MDLFQRGEGEDRMMEIPLTQHLAAFCTRLDYDSLPAEVVDRAKYFFLDYLGVAVRGSLSDSSQPLYRMAGSLASTGQGTVLGRAEKANFPYAALANGTSAHGPGIGRHPSGRVDSSGRIDLFCGVSRCGAGWGEWQGIFSQLVLSALRLPPGWPWR